MLNQYMKFIFCLISEVIEWIPLVTWRMCRQIFCIKSNAVESQVALNEKIVGSKYWLEYTPITSVDGF